MQLSPIDFDSLPWQNPLPGARSKSYRETSKQVRLVEFTFGFIEPDRCERGHIGYVLQGTLEVNFKGELVTYPEGSGIYIPSGDAYAHQARSVTPVVRLILVEDVSRQITD